MPHLSPFTPAERWESAKAAVAGGLAAGLLNLGLLLAIRFFHSVEAVAIRHLFTELTDWTLLASLAIAALSGSLFALTYRYAVRQDSNPQLKTGVVTAFTLVRGLAQVDVDSAIAQLNFWPIFMACGESLVLFGGSAIVLETAFAKRWLKPFGTNLYNPQIDEEMTMQNSQK
ncbi:MAG: hypothetical protein AAF609_13480 [Cyanobacteria bacterium P01_C01_bin.120]